MNSTQSPKPSAKILQVRHGRGTKGTVTPYDIPAGSRIRSIEVRADRVIIEIDFPENTVIEIDTPADNC